MDLFEEIKSDLVKEKYINIWNKYAKFFTILFSLFLIVFLFFLIKNNIEKKQNLEIYSFYKLNLQNNFSDSITVKNSINNIDLIHIINKYYYYKNSDKQISDDIISKVNVDKIKYIPLKEIFNINLRKINDKDYSLFYMENNFMIALNHIESGKYFEAKEVLIKITNDVNTKKIIKDKANEILKLLNYKNHESIS